MTANARVAGAEQELSLLQRAQAGDADAFEQLIDRRLDRAYRMALAILRTEWDARDACQDAFVAAWRQLPRLRDPARLDRWLDRIVINSCRMILRRRRVRVREVPIAEPSDLSGYGTVASPAETFGDEQAVRDAFGRLSPDQRTVVALRYAEGRSVSEIASVLEIPAGTVMWRLFSARRKLARELGEVVR
jgi:RNA polymerase sigma-70 factor, ECF subfamily